MKCCVVDGCDSPIHARELCVKHYKRWYKYGDPKASAPKTTAAERFNSNIRKLDTGCWEWQQVPGSHGYGKISIGGKQVLAHRWSYEHFISPIPDGLQIDHLCRNRRYVNPEHLEPVTPRENLIRGTRWDFNATACIHGHEYTEDNSYLAPDGGRRCRECSRYRDRKRSARRKESA